MTDGVRPVGPVSARDRRAADRRAAERRGETASGATSASRDLVPVGDPVDHDPAGPAAKAEPPGSGAAFAAQLIGQTGQRKGLKGGPPVLDAARSAYLENEYSGDKDRRPPTGKARRTEV